MAVLCSSSHLRDFSNGHLSVLQERKRNPGNENMHILFFSRHQSGKHVLYLNLPALVKF